MKIKLSKLISIALLVGAIGYLIPKTLLMLEWLESGVIRGYFFLVAPVNVILFILSIISAYYFKNNNTKIINRVLILNVIVLISMILWIVLIYGS